MRLLDTELNPIHVPSEGVVLTDYLAEILHIQPGDLLTIEVLEGNRPIVQVPVVGNAKFEPNYQIISALQRDAVRAALTKKVAVLTGGPGTGKTTTVRAILSLLGAKGAKVRLAAPTGRAAKRLHEATGFDACTIHRMLGFRPQSQGFERGPETPLEAGMVMIDEASMEVSKSLPS